jgi:hypothetical protein
MISRCLFVVVNASAQYMWSHAQFMLLMSGQLPAVGKVPGFFQSFMDDLHEFSAGEVLAVYLKWPDPRERPGTPVVGPGSRERGQVDANRMSKVFRPGRICLHGHSGVDVPVRNGLSMIAELKSGLAIFNRTKLSLRRSSMDSA